MFYAEQGGTALYSSCTATIYFVTCMSINHMCVLNILGNIKQGEHRTTRYYMTLSNDRGLSSVPIATWSVS